jgi:arsenate reductase (thioredoxin)
MAEKLGPAKVVFACVANAGRSQMAAALFNALAHPARARAISAGTRPGVAVHPEVVTAMRDLGIDLSSAKPQYLSTDLIKDAHIVITMGCGDECPLVVAKHRVDWQIPDPKELPPDQFNEVRDLIEWKVKELLAAM